MKILDKIKGKGKKPPVDVEADVIKTNSKQESAVEVTEEVENCITLSYTEEEVANRIRKLENSEDIVLYLRIMQGRDELKELRQLQKLMSER